MIPIAVFPTLLTFLAQAQDITRVNPLRQFVITTWKSAPTHVVLSKDGTALCALSIGINGSTLYVAWDIRSGRPLFQGWIKVDPIPSRGGCFAGDPTTAKHPPISLPTWDSPTTPIFIWNIGQQIDLQSRTQNLILQHPGWDAWESYAIVPGWSLSNLEVRPLHSNASQPIAHWVAWNPSQPDPRDTSLPPLFKRMLVWSAFRRNSIECLSADARWIALASPPDPDFTPKEIKAIVSNLGPALRVHMWSVGNPVPVRNLSLARPAVSMEVSPHGNYLLITRSNKECDVIDATTGITIGMISAHSPRVYWSDHEDHLYTFDRLHQTIHRFQLIPFRLDAVFQLSTAHKREFDNILVAPDRERAVGWYSTSSEENVMTTTLQLFDLQKPTTSSP